MTVNFVQQHSKSALSGFKTLLDLRYDDVTPEKVAKGVSFHDSTGTERKGTLTYQNTISYYSDDYQGKTATVKRGDEEMALSATANIGHDWIGSWSSIYVPAGYYPYGLQINL